MRLYIPYVLVEKTIFTSRQYVRLSYTIEVGLLCNVIIGEIKYLMSLRIFIFKNPCRLWNVDQITIMKDPPKGYCMGGHKISQVIIYE